MTKAFALFTLVWFLLVGGRAAHPASPAADLLLVNGNFVTMKARQPSVEAVAVRGDRIVWAGSTPEARGRFASARRMVDLGQATVLPGINDARTHLLSAPYAQSKIVTKLTWDSGVVRIGSGDSGKDGVGDNWPITWADDGNLYTSYGDGPGFSRVPKRELTLGFAKITGDPATITPEDISSDADTPAGGGKSGIKSSGLLMVDRVLWMFVRNYRVDGDYRHSRLAWSGNYGKNWTWTDWYFSDTFGCPEFVQFGPNYAGARDRYVYIVSQANNDAYDYSPDIVMARVPKDKLADRSAYRFFSGLDARGAPAWSADIGDSKPIFTDPRGTQRISLTYNAAIKRYIMTASHRVGEGPHNASLGVFDAPELWGPWTTIYYDDHWSGNDRTYHHKFPTKWMSADGKTMWLLYSGLGGNNYAFCLRKATLELAPRAARK